ncbi:hypothetical protein [Coxiella endosymbiont of Ornithodoros amblus]|uniref:hypothetical protein n=1 Tax=Coxiella endosymbiont of Ornithodoros amblus TaxID=1656166 RepID=UPI00244DC9CE|nr:hypothetical protein [Coxiella endosymbiont of Ornithodoros amblus]
MVLKEVSTDKRENLELMEVDTKKAMIVHSYWPLLFFDRDWEEVLAVGTSSTSKLLNKRPTSFFSFFQGQA